MHTTTRFIHTKTGEVVEVTGTDAELSKIVTITATGRTIRPRTLKTTTLKTSYTNTRGVPYKSAYVALDALPVDHPLAEQNDAPETPQISTRRIDLTAMTDLELSDYGRQKKAERDLAADQYDDAKKELKRRNPDTRLYIYGDTALSVTSNVRFDGSLAKRVLTPQQYEAICMPKPDAARAREVLGEMLYKTVCKDHGNKIEVRFATSEDRERLAEEQEIEEARADATASFYPAEEVPVPF
jgi:hypothetical protein